MGDLCGCFRALHVCSCPVQCGAFFLWAWVLAEEQRPGAALQVSVLLVYQVLVALTMPSHLTQRDDFVSEVACVRRCRASQEPRCQHDQSQRLLGRHSTCKSQKGEPKLVAEMTCTVRAMGGSHCEHYS